MEEEAEDLNAFEAEDCGGAVLVLGVIPAVMNYVFNKEQMGLTVTLGAFAAGLAVVIYLLARFTGWRLIGAVVNLVGCVLVPCYVALAIVLWIPSDTPDSQEPTAEANTVPKP